MRRAARCMPTGFANNIVYSLRKTAMLKSIDSSAPNAWTADDLKKDARWIFRLTDEERTEMLTTVRAAHVPGKSLLAYTRADFPFQKTVPRLAQAFSEARDGRGIALVKGLPRNTARLDEFELLTWAIGLHFGVARPQGKMSQYISPVRNAGTVYRSATGRGYSSNAELDFHTDGADIVVLTCYNAARSGGTSMCSSSVTAYNRILAERPDLAEVLCGTFAFSTQGEQAEGEAPFVLAPIFGFNDGHLFCKWVRNRLETATQLPGAPALSAKQREAVDYLDEVVRRAELMVSMTLEPGDMQILNTHVTLHSRTEFEDDEDEERKRTLYRLWLAPPDSRRLPEGWKNAYKTVEAGAVRGGIVGHHYDAERQAFEQRQARDLGMSWTNPAPSATGEPATTAA